MQNSPLIRLERVSVRYPRNKHFALNEIYLKVDTGEFCVFTGRGGAGKTTLLRLLYADLIPEEGCGIVGDWMLHSLTTRSRKRLRRHLGVVFQDFRLLQHLTVFRNVSLPLEIGGGSPWFVRRSVMESLKKVDMVHAANRLAVDLSAGEQQRVAIARAIVHKPLLLLADEPTGNLDIESAVDVVDLFGEINRAGTTVIVASHNPGLMKRVQHRTIPMEEGTIIDDPSLLSAV